MFSAVQHVPPVSTAINAKHAQQATNLEQPTVSSVPIQRPSWVIYVPNVAQDAKSAQTSTLARHVKPTPRSRQTQNAAATMVTLLTVVPIRARSAATPVRPASTAINVKRAQLDLTLAILSAYSSVQAMSKFKVIDVFAAMVSSKTLDQARASRVAAPVQHATVLVDVRHARPVFHLVTRSALSVGAMKSFQEIDVLQQLTMD